MTDDRPPDTPEPVPTGVLNMMGQQAEHRYIRTRKELNRMLQQFVRSRFQYLHIACHGGDDSFALTLDNVKYHEFAEMAGATPSSIALSLSGGPSQSAGGPACGSTSALDSREGRRSYLMRSRSGVLAGTPALSW